MVNGIRSLQNGFNAERTYVTKHGTMALMNTANIGRRG
jgi:hypothetical protein